MRWFRQKEQLLLVSTEPPFRKPEWAEGRLMGHEGLPYRVTRWVERRPVLLERGGSVQQWEVWGRRVSDRELRDELNDAAERMLAEE